MYTFFVTILIALILLYFFLPLLVNKPRISTATYTVHYDSLSHIGSVDTLTDRMTPDEVFNVMCDSFPELKKGSYTMSKDNRTMYFLPKDEYYTEI